jgi:hypothetical protein
MSVALEMRARTSAPVRVSVEVGRAVAGFTGGGETAVVGGPTALFF